MNGRELGGEAKYIGDNNYKLSNGVGIHVDPVTGDASIGTGNGGVHVPNMPAGAFGITRYISALGLRCFISSSVRAINPTSMG